MMRIQPQKLCTGVLLMGLWGCGASQDEVPELKADPDFAFGGEVSCRTPIDGMDRFKEQGAIRGLTIPLPPAQLGEVAEVPGFGGNIIASDLDADGDIDLFVGGLFGEPQAYENDGHGYFKVVGPAPVSIDLPPVHTLIAWGAVDLNGDLLPEIIYVGAGRFGIHTNMGNWTFSEGQQVRIGEMDDPPLFMTFAIGDADQDGDLDLFLPSDGPISDGGNANPTQGALDYLFLQNEDGVFEEAFSLEVGESGSRSQAAAFTDRDGDGDMDVMNMADLGPPSSFFRMDGVDESGIPIWVDDADEVHADLQMAAMGIDSADLNQDGTLDYCISDVGLPKCLMSDGAGGYYEAHAALGISVDVSSTRWDTIGWSIDLNDLNNDGLIDLYQASGPDPGALASGETSIPDVIWQRQADGSFDDVSEEAGFNNTANHIGLVSADFNGDGFLDIAVAGPGKTVDLHMNQCGEGAWLGVELIGPEGNSEAFGAQIKAQWGEAQQTREIHAIRSHGQGPSRAHFGLGDASYVDTLEIYWPDGHVSLAENVPTRRHLIVRHPNAVEATFGSEVSATDDNPMPDGDAKVTGYVFNVVENTPMEGAIAWDQNDPDTTYPTNSVGRFEIVVPNNTQINLIATDEGFTELLLPIQSGMQSSPQEGVLFPLMPQLVLDTVYSGVFGEERDPTKGTVMVLISSPTGYAYGGTIESTEAEYSGVMSVNWESGTEGGTFIEGDNAIFFFNVTPSERDIEFTATGPDGAPCDGRLRVPIYADKVTFMVPFCQ